MRYLLKSIIVLVSTIVLNAQTVGWSVQTSPTTNNLFGVTYSDVNTWIAVGDVGTIIRSTNEGIDWTNVSSPVTDELRGVSFKGNIGLAVGISGRVIRSTDNGASWIEEQRPTTKNLYSVSIGSTMAVLTGEEGTIFVSTDDGINWIQHFAGTASVLFGVSVYGDIGVGVGGQGAIVNTDNRGVGWGLQILGNQLTFFYGTSFVDSSTGWAVGTSATISSIIIKSELYGFTWSAQTSSTTEGLFGVSFASINNGTAVGSNGAIIHTTNGGEVWANQQSGVTQWLNAVSFANEQLGVVVGNAGTILRTENGGVTDLHQNLNQGPVVCALENNYPNPFNPTTTIKYQIPELSFVTLKVYDVLGNEIATLINEEKPIGSYEVEFDATGLPSGVYFYQLKAGNYIESKKMILLK